jgi:hypothetical protein
MKIQMTLSGKDCLIRDFRVGQFFSKLNAMPGRKKWTGEGRELIFQPSGANIEFLLEHCPEATWEGEAAKLRDNYLDLKMREENTRQEKKEQLVDNSGYVFRTVPFAHQCQAFLLNKDKEVFALLHEQGTGKTKVIIDTAAYLFEKGEIDTLIVVAPIGVHINWVIEELPAHMPERIPYEAVYFSINWRDAELRNMMEAARHPNPGVLRIITFHVEGVRYLPNGNEGKLQTLLREWLTYGKCLIAIDESTTIKNYSADRTKYLDKVGKLARMRRIMTGTQITSGIENLYSQYRFLDPNILGHTSFTSFRSEYCIMGGFEGREIKEYKNVDKLIKIIDGHSHRVLERDCFDLPKQRWKRRPFLLAPKQFRLYEGLRKQALEEITAILGEEQGLKRAQEISIVRALRMHQVVCGLTPTENATKLDFGEADPRMTATLEEIEECAAGGRKVLIWARFLPNLRELTAKLGKAAVSHYGDFSEDEKIMARKRIQNDDRIRYFVGNRSAARGYTLTAANRSVYHSQSSSLDDRLQSQKRNHRFGTTEGVLYIDLESTCTASPDRKIINALRKNKDLADQINRDPRSLFLEEDEE